MASCTTSEKFSIQTSEGTSIYVPERENKVSFCGEVTDSKPIKIKYPSNAYLGYVLMKDKNYNKLIPMGLDYRHNTHLWTKITAYGGGFLYASLGTGVVMFASTLVGYPLAGVLISYIGIYPTIVSSFLFGNLRLKQVSYNYNFGYEKLQVLETPILSTKLINPNPPKILQSPSL